jgi:lysophospholipase L1-like esterase
MSLSKPFEVKIWTSSHGTDYHYFPSNLQKAFNENENERKNNLIQFPHVNAIPGRQTKDKFVSEFQHDFSNISQHERRINIFMLGDNDIRCNDHVGACRIERNVGKLIDLHRNSQHILVVCGLLPSPVTWNYNETLFNRVSNRLQSQIEIANTNSKERRFAFLKLMHIFQNDEGLIDDDKFFEKDKTHLNHLGACQLAKHLIDNIIVIAETFSK